MFQQTLSLSREAQFLLSVICGLYHSFDREFEEQNSHMDSFTPNRYAYQMFAKIFTYEGIWQSFELSHCNSPWNNANGTHGNNEDYFELNKHFLYKIPWSIHVCWAWQHDVIYFDSENFCRIDRDKCWQLSVLPILRQLIELLRSQNLQEYWLENNHGTWCMLFNAV